jgi:hypothetical protein
MRWQGGADVADDVLLIDGKSTANKHLEQENWEANELR